MRDNLVPKLESYLAFVASTPREIDYQTLDCVRFCAGWVAVARGRDLLEDLHWSSLEEGLALLAELGVENLPQAVSKKLTPIPITLALLGDIVALPARQDFTPLGICAGIHSYFLFTGAPLMRTFTIKAAFSWALD